MNFTDRVLKCADCGNDFIFTAGEQLFFFDRQFKNDPKRCKLCKARRSGTGRSTEGEAGLALPLSRTETRTECSACGVETTVPFKPTQGRPVFCRSCFQRKPVPLAVAKAAALEQPGISLTQAMAEVAEDLPAIARTSAHTPTDAAVALLAAGQHAEFLPSEAREN